MIRVRNEVLITLPLHPNTDTLIPQHRPGLTGTWRSCGLPVAWSDVSLGGTGDGGVLVHLRLCVPVLISVFNLSPSPDRLQNHTVLLTAPWGL